MAGLFPSNIVTAEHLAQVNDKIAKVKQAMVEQELAMRAQIADPANTQKLKDALAKLQLFKSVYFPGQ